MFRVPQKTIDTVISCATLESWLAIGANHNLEKIMSYQQLCGALGMLKTNGVELDWEIINEQLKEIARLNTAESSLAMNTAAQPLLRQYRDMCLERGLIRRGELFNLDDCVPLV